MMVSVFMVADFSVLTRPTWLTADIFTFSFMLDLLTSARRHLQYEQQYSL